MGPGAFEGYRVGYSMKNFDHPLITSPQNPGIKAVIALRRRRGRDAAGLIVIEGTREIERALRCGIEPAGAYYCEEIADGRFLAAVLPHLENAAAEISRVTGRVYEKLAYREGSEGMVLLARRPRSGLDGLPLGDNPFYIVADGVEKPGNLGAIFRSADGAGVSGIMVTGGGTDIFGPNAIRASLGTVFTVPSAESSPDEAAAWLRKRKVRIIATSPAASLPYTEADLASPCAVVVGSEDAGASESWLEASDVKVAIPMLGIADSLNVSTSASILAYEALRQRSRAEGSEGK